MKHEQLLHRFASAALAIALSFSGIGCLVTGFELTAGLTVIGWVCAAGALVSILCICLGLDGAIPVLWLLPGLYFLQQGTLISSLESLLYQISKIYDTGYAWGVIYWSDTPPQSDITLVLCLWGALTAMLLTWFLSRGWPVWPGCVLGLLPPAAPLLLTDQVPGEPWIFTLFFAIALILLTQGTRHKAPEQAGKLTLVLALPVAAALCALFLLFPRETYDRQSGAQALEDWVMQWFPQAEDAQEPDSQPVFAPVLQKYDQIDLRAVGPRSNVMSTVMKVTAEENGVLYLREQIYDYYDGVSWNNLLFSEITDIYTPTATPLSLTVETIAPMELLYLPYITQEIPVKGRVENTAGVTAYTLQYTPLEGFREAWDAVPAVEDPFLAPYLQLPDSTAQWAAHRIPQADLSSAGAQWRLALTIADMVRTSARYDLQTKVMPIESKDFARWFVEESETGYCTHFATAATVLLRAAGIPARYVTGYLVDARAGKPVMVAERSAHAWVECYISGIGWQVLEPTPAGGSSPVPEDQPDLPTAPETQPETEPETPPETQPEQTTAPEPQTQPSTQPPEATAASSGTEDPGEVPKGEPPAWLGTLLRILAVLLAILGQWQLRLWLRGKRFARGTPNRQALLRFREILRHCRIRRRPPEREIVSLAQKAKYSSHTITEEELSRLDACLEASRREFRRQKLWLQPIYTLLFALY